MDNDGGKLILISFPRDRMNQTKIWKKAEHDKGFSYVKKKKTNHAPRKPEAHEGQDAQDDTALPPIKKRRRTKPIGPNVNEQPGVSLLQSFTEKGRDTTTYIWSAKRRVKEEDEDY